MAVMSPPALKSVVNRDTFRVQLPLPLLWDLLSNTQRVNQTLGLPPALFTPLGGTSGMDAKATFMGLRFNWIERPFEWVLHRWYRVQRDFEGPLEKVVIGVEFTALSESQTEIIITVDVTPTNPIGHVMARTVFGRNTLQQYRTLVQEWERKYQRHEVLAFPVARPPEVNGDTLDRLAQKLYRDATLRLPAPLIDQLVTHLRTAQEDEVVRMRPLAMADVWGTERMETIRLFLYATRSGILDLQWEVLCPNCRVSKASYAQLTDLENTAHCETCQITFDATFDQYVELRFSVHPSIRTATAYSYCVGGPFVTRHIVAQRRVPPQSRQSFELDLEAGEYRLRVGGAAARVVAHCRAEHTDTEASLPITEAGVESPDLTLAAAQPLTLWLENSTSEEQLFIIEQSAWDAQVLSAAQVTTLQEFRDLFSSEVLSVGMGVEIRTLTLMFTDLKGSTKMYLDAGDSHAYSRVRDQFAVLMQEITLHRGALVKTIGDSVMAVFYDAPDAIRAGLAMQRGITALNQRTPEREPLRLKVGIHSGPCIVITANQTLDYFGTTVNTACYAGALGNGGDVVLTEWTRDQPGVAALLEPLIGEAFTSSLKGMESALSFYRVREQEASPL